MSPGPMPSGDDDRINLEAANWVGKQDRGFSPEEQDEFSHWLAEDPRHRARFIRQQKTWELMGHLDNPGMRSLSGPADPEVIAVERFRLVKPWLAIASLAAVLALGFFMFRLSFEDSSGAARLMSHSKAAVDYERYALADGSFIEMKGGTRIEILYSEQERRVNLLSGEAHFTVARDASRPFVVSAGESRIKALGTAFNVQLNRDFVEVVVTEGRVSMERKKEVSEVEPVPLEPQVELELTVGQKAAHYFQETAALPVVESLTTEEIEKILFWKNTMLDFVSVPLSEVVIEFNKRNITQLILVDSELSKHPITAAFKSNNLQGFVRLLELTMGIKADFEGEDRIVL
ncbi:MAG: FecR domain-containing protein, partial [Proteobacteria bacterium]|nr:FecR domain-containing protein [Pseudomonadota bacterium]